MAGWEQYSQEIELIYNVYSFSFMKFITLSFLLCFAFTGCKMSVLVTEPSAIPYKTAHFTIYYDANDFTSYEIEIIGLNKEELLAHINSYLGTSYDRTIEIFISDTIASASNTVPIAHATYTEENHENPLYTRWDNGHEIAHIVSFQEWGSSWYSFLKEGIAEASSYNDKGTMFSRLIIPKNSTSSRDSAVLLMIDEIQNDVLSSSNWQRTSYEYFCAGLFCDYLKLEFGIEKLKNWYQSTLDYRNPADQSFMTVFGISLDDALKRFAEALGTNL